MESEESQGRFRPTETAASRVGPSKKAVDEREVATQGLTKTSGSDRQKKS